MIKLVDITYSEHQIFAYHYLHRNLLSAHMPATSAAGAGKERALKLNPLFLLFFSHPWGRCENLLDHNQRERGYISSSLQAEMRSVSSPLKLSRCF